MPTHASSRRQRSFEFRAWGGPRAGAGPKLRRPRPAVPHRPRPDVRPYQPVHVSLRLADHVWSLRSQRSFAILHRAVEGVRRRSDFRIVHFTILGNHVHLLVEAGGASALACGMRAFSIRVARGLNEMMGRSGPVVDGRYFARALKTPAEVRNALRYVLGNFASHARRRGEPVPEGFVDPFSSVSGSSPRARQLVLWPAPATEAPKTWLLRTAAGSGRRS